PLVHDVIRDHHSSDDHGKHDDAVACVKLANMMCASKGLGSTTLPWSEVDSQVLTGLHVRDGDIKPLVDRMEHLIGQNQALMDMAD
ncbi:MAG: hypothetical protein R3236_00500, partial [Phycisphaeraceae bacterium]|nr:hypothetical protein [Phycisphaeraceae bacterium]